MTDKSPETGPDEAMGELAETVAGLAISVVELRDFLGLKVAREAMDELGLSGKLDHEADSALEGALGTAAATGMVLSMRAATEPTDIAAVTMRLTDELPEPIKDSMGRLIPLLIDRGIAFHRDDLSQQTDKSLEWVDEYKRLRATDPTHPQP